VGILVDKLEL
jgi:hypothetical protein